MAIRKTLDLADVDEDEHEVIVSLDKRGGLSIMYGTSGEADKGSMLNLYPSETRDLLRLLINQFPLDALSGI